MFSKYLVCGHLFSFSYADADLSWLQETCFSQLTFVDIWDATHWFSEIQGLHFENSWHLEGSVVSFHVLSELLKFCTGHAVVMVVITGVLDISVAVESYGGIGRPTRSCLAAQALSLDCQTSYGQSCSEQACKHNFLHLPLGRRSSTVWSSSSLIVSDSRLNQWYSRIILFCFGHRRDLHEACSHLGSFTVISWSCVPTEESSTNSSTTAEIPKNVDLLLHLPSLVHLFAFFLYLQCNFMCKTTDHY